MATTLVTSNDENWSIPERYGGGTIPFRGSVAIGDTLANVMSAFGGGRATSGRLEFQQVADGLYPNVINQLNKTFVSAELTGTGGVQTIAHGLGIVPGNVVISPTDLTPAATGAFTVSEGVHTATNILVTVTSGKKYKIHAEP